MFKKQVKKMKNEKGFTLIELLAVIVILGIIAAVAVPMIGNVISDSRVKAEYSDALNIISAARLADAQNVSTGDNDSYEPGELTTYLSAGSGSFTSVKKVDNEWTIFGHSLSTEGTGITESKLKTDLEALDKNK